MVDRVVDHLRGPEVPDVAHVFWQIGNQRRDDLPPNQILLETLAREALFGACQGLEPVDTCPRSALCIDLAVLDQSLQVSVGHLPGNAYGLGESCSDAVAILRNQFKGLFTSPFFVRSHEQDCNAIDKDLTI